MNLTRVKLPLLTSYYFLILKGKLLRIIKMLIFKISDQFQIILKFGTAKLKKSLYTIQIKTYFDYFATQNYILKHTIFVFEGRQP